MIELKKPETPDEVIDYIVNMGYYLSRLKEDHSRLLAKESYQFDRFSSNRDFGKFHEFAIVGGQEFIDTVWALGLSMMEAKINEIDTELKLLIK